MLRVLFVVTLIGATALAGKKPDPDEQRARVLFADGQKAYDVGEFDRALALYSDAYKLKPLAGFLFNIGQCHRQLGNFERAAFFFGRFIDNSKPDAPNVSLAQELKADMEKRNAERLDAEKKAAETKAEADRKAADAAAVKLTPVDAPPPPPPVVAVVPETEPVTTKPLFWVALGGGVAVIAGGIITGIVLSQPREVMYTPRMTSLPDIDGRR